MSADELSLGQRVRVHYNLHRHDFSIGNPSTGRVVANVFSITLDDVSFRVGEKTRQATIRTGRRSVMAYGIGTIGRLDLRALDGLTQVTYNPFRLGAFHVKATGQPVWHADRVVFQAGYCWTEEAA